jgi:hypothetical protein
MLYLGVLDGLRRVPPTVDFARDEIGISFEPAASLAPIACNNLFKNPSQSASCFEEVI